MQAHRLLATLQAKIHIQVKYRHHILVQMQDTLARNVQMACFALQHKHQLKTASVVMVGYVVIALKDGFAYPVQPLGLAMDLSPLLLRFWATFLRKCFVITCDLDLQNVELKSRLRRSLQQWQVSQRIFQVSRLCRQQLTWLAQD